MKLVFVGPQASGKGTQGKIIASKLKIPHISSGDLLRNATGELKEKIEEYTSKGMLAPSEIVLELIQRRINQKDCKEGFILDGFPRNLEQVKELEKITSIDKVIEISISDDEAVRRLTSRVTCELCAAVFNEITNPPKVKGKCDFCGGRLVRRTDDNEAPIRQRLKVYHEQTEPILSEYDSIKINGQQSIEKVTEDVLKSLS
ncbi:MAG: nucleoside monophosphate kinase [archaeon]